MGANSYRTSHYPYAEEILDFADQNGIVIIGLLDFLFTKTHYFLQTFAVTCISTQFCLDLDRCLAVAQDFNNIHVHTFTKNPHFLATYLNDFL